MVHHCVEVECHACGHTWCVDLEHPDEVEMVVYRSEEKAVDYRVQCPNCNTYNIITVPEGDKFTD
ncbi:MAG: hypothetical protein JXA33_10110 [Anaerolineae bacterium]|nr:hypothetical protein [Anaerolineae bacterium]